MDNYLDHKDFRQTGGYARFMKQIGWQVIEFQTKDLQNRVYAYLWKVPLLDRYYLSFHRIPPTISIKEVVTYAMKHNVLLIKIDFNATRLPTHVKRALNDNRFTHTTWCNAPSKTKMIPLRTMNMNEIYNQIKAKTRYNIRLAAKKDFTVKLLPTNELINTGIIRQFHSLLLDRYEQKGLDPLTLQQIRQLLAQVGKKAVIGVAMEHRVLIAATVFLGSSTTLSYTQNFATPQGKKLFAPTRLIWEGIQYAKQNKFKYFDFDGIIDKRNPGLTGSWGGFTRFKNGFGGIDIELELPYVWTRPHHTMRDYLSQVLCREYLKRTVLPSIYPSTVEW